MYSVLLNHLKALSKSFQRRASVPPVPPIVRAAPVRARTVPAESPATLQVRAWDPADRTLRSESGESDWAEALEGNGGGEVCDGEHSPPSGVRPAGAIGSDTDRHDLNCDLRATLTPASRGAGVRLDPLSRQGISRGASDCIFFDRDHEMRGRERGDPRKAAISLRRTPFRRRVPYDYLLSTMLVLLFCANVLVIAFSGRAGIPGGPRRLPDELG